MARQVTTAVMIAVILAIMGYLTSFVLQADTTYASKEELKQLDEKLDKILESVTDTKIVITAQKKDIEYIKEALEKEITRSKEVDRDHERRLIDR